MHFYKCRSKPQQSIANNKETLRATLIWLIDSAVEVGAALPTERVVWPVELPVVGDKDMDMSEPVIGKLMVSSGPMIMEIGMLVALLVPDETDFDEVPVVMLVSTNHVVGIEVAHAWV